MPKFQATGNKLSRSGYLVAVFIVFISVNGPLALAQADITPPLTSATLDPSSPDGNNGWYVSPVDVSLSATDLESGVQSINYRLDGGTWTVVNFEDTLNLAPNASFEIYDGTSTARLRDWAATIEDADTLYSQDTTVRLTGFGVASAKIATTGTGWHGINHATNFGVTTYLSNMAATVWMKTENVTSAAYFKVYAVVDDGLGGQVYSLLDSSPTLTGTNDWTELTLEFVANAENILGIYLDIGLDGDGTVWADAVTLSDSLTDVNTFFTIGTDGEHTLEYYSIDRSGNAEGYSCSTPVNNCEELQIDQTPPGNWHDSGAVRGLFGSSHEVYVYTNVQDSTSGLSTFTDKYQYHTDRNEGFGRFQNILGCNSSWLQNEWVILISPPFFPGVHEAFLLTPKTDFCDSDWKVCKIVKFQAEDLAGNIAQKDYCINGPWIKMSGEGAVRANQNIDMLAEPEEDNMDGLIEVGGNIINFFTSSRNWEVRNQPEAREYDYDYFMNNVKATPDNVSSVPSTSGIYEITGDVTLSNGTLPSNYDTATFDQIIFVNGNLRIENDVATSDSSSALFVVSGNVEIDKNTDLIQIAIVADGTFDTAYDVEEGQHTNTLTMQGIFSADKFIFKRTLQGTNNARYPSEEFVFDAKYMLGLSQYIGSSTVKWLSVE